MKEHTFTLWLKQEVASAKWALLTLYEQKDKLEYIDGPRLEQEYMEKVGAYEETVIREEIECELLRKKQQMVQTAINRREPIDEAAIDAKLDQEREQMLNEAVGPEKSDGYAALSAADSEELQEIYKEIVKNYHPQTHPELTEMHRKLFQKAQDAYRRRDLAALRLIDEMLRSTEEDGIALEFSIELAEGTEIEGSEKVYEHETDYTLAGQIYSGFQQTMEEADLQEKQAYYHQLTNSMMKEIENMRLQFPFVAEEMLSDPSKVENYKEELSLRMRAATTERERRTKEIRMMIERVTANG